MSSKQSARPRVVLVSRCFVIGEGNRLLIIRRAATDTMNPGKWECPGGKLDIGQDLSHAQKREVMEETGLLVQQSFIFTLDSFVIGTGKYTGLTYVVLFSINQLIGGTLSLSEEHSAYAWVTYDELLAYDLTQECREAAIVLSNYLKV